MRASPVSTGALAEGLEVEAQRKLQITGVVVLARYLHECCPIGRVGTDAVTAVGVAPVGMIEHVERFGAELEADALGDREFLEQPHVPIVETRVVDQVANPILANESSGSRRRPFQSASGSDGVAVGFIERINPPISIAVSAVMSHGLLVIDAAVIEGPELAENASQTSVLSDAGVILTAA